MKKVSLTINEKIYEKTKPTIQDWFDIQEYESILQDPDLQKDKNMAEEMAKIVVRFLGFEPEEVQKKDFDLEEVVKAFYTIRSNIVECFKPTNGEEEKK